eukprot:GHRR01020316.1.p2 GENE.GHRR01020316.1~~GHRR01020316.1.p2  ORF type:complete len:152 (-),score=24.64 GHRR01020316.1:1971-2426(-)
MAQRFKYQNPWLRLSKAQGDILHPKHTMLLLRCLHALCMQNADIMVTGTLGLAAPKTKEAIKAAAKIVKDNGGKVMIDVNWRPVFWNDVEVAKKEIVEFLDMADIVKISDADLEFLYDMQYVTALLNPCSVSACGCMCASLSGVSTATTTR